MATTTTKKAATKTAATKRTTKRAAAKPKPKPQRRPVTLNGKPASNRHFLLDTALYQSAVSRCQEDGVAISDVLRHGIEVYSADAPRARDLKPALDVLPKNALKDLKEVWTSGDSERATHYVAALHRSGWTVQAIANSLVESGAVSKMSRQAISLRALKAPEELRDDLPEVPTLGPRRAIVAANKGQKGEYKAPKTKARDRAHDLSFRIADDDYARATRRAKHEGAMMSGVLDNILASYLAGEYDNVFRNEDADNA